MAFFESMLMSSGAAATKAAAAALAKKSGAAFWDKVLAPKLSESKADKDVFARAKKYLGHVDKITKNITSVAVPGGTIPLSDVYIPLTLADQLREKRFRLDKYPEALFSETRRILVTDTAGMGKSTAFKFIVQTSLLRLEKIPLLVELRKIPEGVTLLEFICREFTGSDKVAASVIENILAGGNVLLLLDGYDEVDDSLRKRVNGEIVSLANRFDACNFIVSSRPDSELKGLAGFAEYMIERLHQAEAFELIRKYGKNGDVAERLISKIRGNSQVRDFLGNPLLVSLLFKAFDYKNTVPFKRHIFFRQVFDALYQDHDLSKGAGFERKKKTGLDIEDFHKVLRALGIVTYLIGRVQYPSEEFHSAIDGAKKIVFPLEFDSGKLRSDLLSAVPVFQRDGTSIKWVHKAFQDYFVAQYIYYDGGKSRDELVVRLISEDNPRKNENVLVILSDRIGRLFAI
jgi:hypothetical protein